jgi:hypothetical protein
MSGTVTRKAHVRSFLAERSTESLCCNCIAAALGMQVRDVRNVTLALEGSGQFRRAYGSCTRCAQRRLVFATHDDAALSDGATQPESRLSA